MNTITKQKRIVASKKVSVVRFMYYFKKFTRTEQQQVAEQINQTTFKERWDAMDKVLPNVEMAEDEIMNEVSAVRYGRKAGKNRA